MWERQMLLSFHFFHSLHESRFQMFRSEGPPEGELQTDSVKSAPVLPIDLPEVLSPARRREPK